jgi:hypothetical protein
MSNVNWDAVSRAVDPRDPDAVYDLIGDKITSLPFVTVDPASVKPRDAVRLVCTSGECILPLLCRHCPSCRVIL